jgi:hypothetical protein
VRRPLLTPSWLVRHVLTIGLVVAFLLLGRWQWHRAESGNSLSFAYTFEWPLFAAFVAFFWWKMLHFEIHPPAETPADEIDLEDEPAEAPPAPVDTTDDPELAAYNNYLANLNEEDHNK